MPLLFLCTEAPFQRVVLLNKADDVWRAENTSAIQMSKLGLPMLDEDQMAIAFDLYPYNALQVSKRWFRT